MVSVGVAGAHVQPVLEKFYSLLAAGLWLPEIEAICRMLSRACSSVG